MKQTHTISRRQLLQVGGIGGLGLGLPGLLHAGATAEMGRRHAADKSCIFIFLWGGPSHIDTFDVKPTAPAEIRGPYKPIATSVPGIQYCELLPRMARQANQWCHIRSMTHRGLDHPSSATITLAGQSNPSPDAPFFGHALAKVRPSSAAVPSFVWLMEPRQPMGNIDLSRVKSGGFLGSLYSPLMIGDIENHPALPNFRAGFLEPPAGVSADQIRQRFHLLLGLEQTAPSQPGYQELSRFQERAVDLTTKPAARAAFDIQQEPDKVRERYGRNPLGGNLLLARRLIEAGVRLVNVVGETRTNAKWAPINFAEHMWDMHTDIFTTKRTSTTTGLDSALPRLDQAVSALMDDLSDRGLLETTLVVLVGEFGRSPKINTNNRGREHWPPCYSALLAGAGIRGGIAYGASDKDGAYVKDKPVAPETFGATLFHALGVPPETRLAPDGFTRPASKGQPILELF
jgi:hypothetical protein